MDTNSTSRIIRVYSCPFVVPDLKRNGKKEREMLDVFRKEITLDRIFQDGCDL